MTISRMICVAFCVTLSITYLKAQKQQVVEDNEIRLLYKKLDSVISKEHIPGLMVSIVNRDSILFSAGLGFRDIARQLPVDRNTTKFHLASITKFFVAMGIQQLVKSGQISLEDRVRDLAPEISIDNPWEATHPVRLIHLLEHTAGFNDVQLNSMINITGKPLRGLEAIKAVENSLTVRWKPGEMMAYSNPGYNVLGYILEKVSGKPWDQQIHNAIFAPLEMKDSFFDLDAKSHPDLAIGYDLKDGYLTPFPLYLLSGNGAGSSLVSTANDMCKFMYYLLNGSSENNLLDSIGLKEMETIHSTLASKGGLQTGYALGNELFPNNKKVSFRGHNGKGEGFVSWIFFNREAGLAYAIAANCVVNLWPVSQVIEEYLTKDIEAPHSVSLPIKEDEMRLMLGHYQFMNPKNERWDFYKRIFNVVKIKKIENNKLVIERGKGQVDSLIHVGDGIYRLKGDILPSFILARDSSGVPFFQGYGSEFYRKLSYWKLVIQQVPIYLGCIAIIFYLIISIVGLFLTLFRKIKLINVLIPLFPVVGAFSFLYAYRLIGLTDGSHKELFASMNWTSFSIFSGMLLFSVFTLVSCMLLWKYWQRINNRWLRFFYAFNNLFICYIVTIFILNGWIGVPIWMM